MSEIKNTNTPSLRYFETLFAGAQYLGICNEKLSRVMKVNPEIIEKWSKDKERFVTAEELERWGHKDRIVQFLRMFSILTSWYSKRETQLSWLTDNHDLFGRVSPLQYMINGDSDKYLDQIVDYLERITKYH